MRQSKEIAEIKRRVLEKIKPTREEEELLERRSREIVELLERILEEYNPRVEVLGSFAKGTRIRGKREIDVFILVEPPKRINRKNYIPYLEELVRKLIERIDRRYELRYANHPYVHVILDDIEADLVPGFLVEEASQLISPVDRSPFHARYVKEVLDERLRDEVRVLKQFLKGMRAYGAEIKVQGLSGYACELLIASEKSFERALEAIKKLKFIDPAGHYDLSESVEEALEKGLENLLNSVMTIVDPVDARRNVAAALSRETYARLKLAISYFFSSPSEAFFFVPDPPLERPNKNTLVLYGKKESLSEDVIRGKLRRIVKIVKKAAKEDPNLSFYVKDVYPGTYKDRRYVVVKFLDFYSDRGKIRGPKVGASKGFERLLDKEVRIESPVEVKDRSKKLIRDECFKKKKLKEALYIIRKERLSLSDEFFLEAYGKLKYSSAIEALRRKIRGGLPVRSIHVRPLESLPEDFMIDKEGPLRPIKYVYQIVSGSS